MRNLSSNIWDVSHELISQSNVAKPANVNACAQTSMLLNWGNVTKRQHSLLLPSSACGSNRFDTRLLMNLISLMCLCSLSPESLLLFNGVLQSYLISLPHPRPSPSTPATRSLPVTRRAPCNTWNTEGTLCLTDLCYRAEKGP